MIYAHIHVNLLTDRIYFYSAQCEKEYHVGCLRSQWQVDLKVSREQPYASFGHPSSSHFLMMYMLYTVK
jgi:hypothetical protein